MRCINKHTATVKGVDYDQRIRNPFSSLSHYLRATIPRQRILRTKRQHCMKNLMATHVASLNTLPELTVQQYRKLNDSLHELVCVIDATGRFLYVNSAANRLIGYSQEEIVGTYCYDYMVPEDRERSLAALTDFTLGGDPFLFENRYRHKSGSVVTMSWIGNWDPDDQLLYCTGRDITEKKKKEEELEVLSLIAKETVNTIILTDLNGHITWVNDAFTRTTGYTPEEVIGKKPGPLLACSRKDRATKSRLDAGIGKPEPFLLEIENGRKDGSTFWWEVSYQPIYDKNGQVKQFFSINTDITERKRLQAELQQQQRRHTAAVIAAQEKERSIVSQELHDNINQVLTTVKLYNELCVSDPSNAEALLRKSTQLLQSSIDEIRSLSKRLSAPSLGKLKFEESIRELVQTVAETERLSICLDTNGIEELIVDQEVHLTVYRVLQEHLTNILRHAEASLVEVVLDFEEGLLTLLVKDDGKGFDVKAKRKGVGITNMITRIESLNGTLDIQSRIGKGAILKMHIPLSL
jgi:PAS domain S-box-containing protein